MESSAWIVCYFLHDRYVLPKEGFYYQPHPEISYVVADHESNDQGFRGSTMPEEGGYRIFCLGGSTTWTGYPEKMEEILRDRSFTDVYVGNYSLPLYTTRESLWLFENEVLKFDPDLVIVYHNVNDAVPELYPPDEYQADYSHFRVPFEYPGAPWQNSLRSYWLIRYFFREDLEKAKTGPLWTTTNYRQSDRTPEAEELNVECNAGRAFEKNLREIVSLAKENGIDVIIANMAVPDVPKLPGLRGFPEFKAIVHGMERHNRQIDQLQRELDFVLLDLEHYLPWNLGDYVDFCHTSETGSEKKAILFADLVERRFLNPALSCMR